MAVPLPAYLVLGAILFAIGVVGVATRRNVLIIFMCVELMMNAVNLTFVAFASAFQALDGQVFVFFILVVAAAEVAVGLAIIYGIFRHRETVDVTDMTLMKG